MKLASFIPLHSLSAVTFWIWFVRLEIAACLNVDQLCQVEQTSLLRKIMKIQPLMQI